MSDLGTEHGKEVIVPDRDKVVLYDHRGNILKRETGFRPNAKA